MDINVKDIIIKPINSTTANAFVKKHHYSGKVVPNSQLHFGAFYDAVLHGVMSFGPSLDKSKIIGLVKDTKWNDFLELNRMAFDDYLPKNSESRSISVAMKLIKNTIRISSGLYHSPTEHNAETARYTGQAGLF